MSPPRRIVRAILYHVRHAALAQHSFAARFAPHAQFHQVKRAELAVRRRLHYEVEASFLVEGSSQIAGEASGIATATVLAAFGFEIVTLVALLPGACSLCSLLSFPVNVAISAPENPEKVATTTIVMLPVSP